MRKASYFLPLLFLLALLVYFFFSLGEHQSEHTSRLLHKPAPAFSLPRFEGEGETITQETLKGQLTLVNFFSSRCRYCVLEHEGLIELIRSKNLRLVGIHLKGNEKILKNWFKAYENPYAFVAIDHDMTVAMDWGVVSTPETFVLNKEGVVVFHHRGPLSPKVILDHIIPLIEKAQP